MLENTTACPLDCYDACLIFYEDGKLKALKKGHTNGFLCPHMNHFEKNDFISTPRYKGKEITIEEALEHLELMLKESNPNEVLHYKGSGNFSLLQDTAEHFFASFGATLTNGSLCDGAGEAGIIEGRGSNKNMPFSEIEKSEVIIFWGRNPHTTSSHLLPIIKNKTIIVIDPIKTKIAKMADLHIQIKPHRDLFLAMLLSRFLYIYDTHNEEYLEKFASEYEDYHELTQSIRIVPTLNEMDVNLSQIEKVLELVEGKKVSIICGVGIQKYVDGADVIRAIDAFGVMLGLFGKEGSGVAYLGSSKEKITSPFFTDAKRVSKVDTEFSDFETVFIQGANPLSQMPDSFRVKKSISKTKNVIYFGLYENETSQIADLIIPAKSFLYKDDVRTSYSHNSINFMPKQKETNVGISEYDLSSYFCTIYNIKLESEEFYINYFKSFAQEGEDGLYEVKGREKIPYKDGFDTEDSKFLFLDEVDCDIPKSTKLHLITSKSPLSLNSQFHRDNSVYLHSSLGFVENEKVFISSVSGSVELRVKVEDDLREDCVLIFSGTKGVNNLTSSKHSYEGKNAIYQENRVEVNR
ncbi:molybdopterin-dependent oxidoreductase [Sulfurimonas sp.]|uniref:molybdopterin-dependent oxidoreductase n=1 Tax=Sulfurimonas sp. TaxID=2022749 RepID=UPI002B476900|nr:molybdopterin-dependent oxidoreductase [Sulfurimonas sp.]